MLHAAQDRYGLLVCSPLRQARQTAHIVSARSGLPVAAELADLREVKLGQRFPGGESGDELVARTARALGGIAAGAAGTDAVVVADGASIRAAVLALTGQPHSGCDLATGDVARLSVTRAQGALTA